ncbi:MAG: glycoside hydrolase family 3 C-terminal domain-containing protein [Lachnospiraceae bacterium]|nr:glycoside hydrolase family 3 C-terminal domain-containing protein [Lachnospiraceae bacterium]
MTETERKKKIDRLVAQMSLKDKIAFCTGANFWQTKTFEKYDFPALFMCDGPLGLRKQENTGDMLGINDSRPATCFPAEVTTASSWDPSLTEMIGRAMAEEACDQNVGLVLGPGANLKRNPLCGRNFEYFSEDPYLAGKMAAGFIRGMESEGIGSCLKHFAVNSQELKRFTSDGIIDDRTLRELYLTAFEIAVKEGKPATLMCSYPKLNGIHASDHKELLTDILRDEWGFEGMVVTDWGAMNDRIEGFRAGCDLNMPGGSNYMEKAVKAAVENGSLPAECVDNSVRRILNLVLRAEETHKKWVADGRKCDYDAHHELAKKAAIAGAVLLKNNPIDKGAALFKSESLGVDSFGNESVGAVIDESNGRDRTVSYENGPVSVGKKILPLQEGTKLAVIGAMAKNMRYQGAGSSHINATKLSEPLDFLPGAVYAAGCEERGDTNEALIAEAVEAAKEAEVAVVFAGLPGRYESEGFDREDMNMPEGHNRLIAAVAAANPNTVVVLLCGAPVACPWADNVKAILYMGLPGQAGGEAIADLLYGRANPSGRLAESWPFSYEDVPSSECYLNCSKHSPASKTQSLKRGLRGKLASAGVKAPADGLPKVAAVHEQVEKRTACPLGIASVRFTTEDALYEEGIYVGYRYYDKAGVKVRWPFGYGLSYTNFAFSDLTVMTADNEVNTRPLCTASEDTGVETTSGTTDSKMRCRLSVTVTNTGNRAGDVVVPLYVAAPAFSSDTLHRPLRELKAFEKVYLEAGESRTIFFTLDDRAFSVWHDGGWVIPGGEYTIIVDTPDASATPFSESSHKTGRLTVPIVIDGATISAPAWQKGSFYETCAGKPQQAEWEAMLGRKYEPPKKPVKGEFTMESTVEDMKDHSFVMKIMYNIAVNKVAKRFDGASDEDNPEFKMFLASSVGGPIRSMQISGGLKDGIMQGLVEMANGHYLKGLWRMIIGR